MNIFCNEEHVKNSKYGMGIQYVIMCMIPEWDLNPYLLCLNDRVCNITPSGYLNILYAHISILYTEIRYKDTLAKLFKVYLIAAG